MLLTDTTVLVAHFRNPTPARASLIVTELAGVSGIAVSEFRAGGRTPAQALTCDQVLGLFQEVATPESVWPAAGRNQAFLQSNGLIVPLDDTIIATTAIIVGIELWTYDTHFTAMATLLPGLRLFREP